MARRPHAVGCVVITSVVACVLAAGCGAQAPTAPAPVSSAPLLGPSDAPVSPLAGSKQPTAVHKRVRDPFTFDLLEGTVTVTLADGSAMWGTYQGTANVPASGQSRATLAGTLTGGTGRLSGATGDIVGNGTGGFANDGEFAVALRAAVVTSDGQPLDLRLALRGVSTSTCTTTAPPRMALSGTGSAKGIGSASGHLQHDLGTRICAVIVE